MTVEGRLIMAFKPPKFYHRDPRSPAPASDTQVPVQIQQHKDRTDTSTDTRTSTNAETSSDDIRADASVGDKVIESPNVQECIQEKQQGDTQQQTDSEEADDTTEESDSNDNAPPTRSRNAFSLLMDE
ncbi:hypothetical protein SARC_07957 [Sphaeroforma arctica JP610]|uniref:Uncharacterized protein n=1 Tax=Sphaeroforma arctica JP610 TaxID=667725 RepID=A0A0L0FSW9_9EUKA|nr:hypothetical protein SARC_07957 [Sphaeroforma arctica JP610]KNC79656.1 hypothetical protein SARC_07957 [Sphaeroforma arctica JP610]|eukprot:XP_014153558.1 hypothetical protein SARC_07957 [Sphaeroforma arctica JP610]